MSHGLDVGQGPKHPRRRWSKAIAPAYFPTKPWLLENFCTDPMKVTKIRSYRIHAEYETEDRKGIIFLASETIWQDPFHCCKHYLIAWYKAPSSIILPESLSRLDVEGFVECFGKIDHEKGLANRHDIHIDISCRCTGWTCRVISTGR